jgi:hypothetical protein
MNTGAFNVQAARTPEWLVADEMIVEEGDDERESGVHPTLRCLMQGDDLCDALLQLCHDYVPSTRIWSIAPRPRRRH